MILLTIAVYGLSVIAYVSRPGRRAGAWLLLLRDRKFKAARNTILDVLSAPFVRLFGDVPNLRAIAMAG
jgi:hypothetical protein